MKRLDAIHEWCAGAAAELGDPSKAVCQVFARWEPELVEAVHRTEEAVCGMFGGGPAVWLGEAAGLLPLDLATDEPALDLDRVCVFGAERIAPGLWAIRPSLNAEGLIHAFLVFYDVPEPPPWERRILVP